MTSTQCGFADGPNGTGAALLVTQGPTLAVDIGFDATYQNTPGLVPAPGIRGVDALVDTGATESCIDSILASQLNLPIVDRRPIAGVGGKHMVNIYLAQINVPSLSNTVIYGNFAGVDLQAGGQTHVALIGGLFATLSNDLRWPHG